MHILPSSLPFLRLMEKKDFFFFLKTPKASDQNTGQPSPDPLRLLSQSHVAESRQKAAGSAASYANKGEDKSTAHPLRRAEMG